MTFPQALKKLAEPFPEKFDYNDELFTIHHIGGGQTIIDEGHYTQDDIDTILAEIGWEYAVWWSVSDIEEWYYAIRKIQSDTIKSSLDFKYATKLHASQAALIAVAEKIQEGRQ